MVSGDASQASILQSHLASPLPHFPIDGKATGKLMRLALIGTFAPRRCGIATFTTDIRDQLLRHNPDIGFDVYALEKTGASTAYEGVASVIGADDPQAYIAAAQRINQSGVDAVWIQHEFGIFGGPDGEMIRLLVDRIAAPLVFTFHTVLSEPTDGQRAALQHLVDRASRIMVMTSHARDIVIAQYGARPRSVQVIPHGAPDRPFGREAAFKAKLGLEQSNIIMTFGLIGPGKGLERIIEAMPRILERHPDTLYRIVGCTHPALLEREGEQYRDSLHDLARRLGVERQIQWDNRFLETDELLDQLEASDIFVTPYPNLQQSSSGTLSYALALGKAVVSTPYLHARELLADGVGKLVEPNSAEAIADAVNALLDDPIGLASLKLRAYTNARRTIWPEFSKACTQMLRAAVAKPAPELPTASNPGLHAVFSMSDNTGMLQHSIGIVPDRNHGYCLDDNVRALMLMHVAEPLSQNERLRWTTVYASFLQHAWHPDVSRFRNFMNFDRSWCEEIGSEDSNGRALWSLGHTAAYAPDVRIRAWGREWFDRVAPHLASLQYPRAISFAMLGAACMLRAEPANRAASKILLKGGAIINALLDASRRPAWSWFEALLGYDNPRISQALVEAGVLCRKSEWVASGLETMEWIAGLQTSVRGQFRPIGSETFGKPYTTLPFDQQPLEAWAAIDAAVCAYNATHDRKWIDFAMTAYRWYFGANDRGIAIAEMNSGRCYDGLTPRGANENSGAESILAFQLAHHAIEGLAGANRLRPQTGGETRRLDAHTTAHSGH